NRLGFKLTMFIRDLDRFLADKDHLARAEGCVDSTVHGKARRVDRGRFNLFVEDEATGMKRMLYHLQYVGEDGETYLLDGSKLVKDDPGIDLWADNTTLFTRVRKGGADDSPVVAIGVLRIGVAGFARLLASVRVRNSPNASTSLRSLATFGRFFL